MYTINRVSTLLLTHSLIRIVTYIGNSCNNNNRNLSVLLHIPTTHLLVTTQILFTELHSVHPQPPFVIVVDLSTYYGRTRSQAVSFES